MQSAYAPPPRKSACWKCSCEAHMHYFLGKTHVGSAYAKRICTTSYEICMLEVRMRSASALSPRKYACWECACKAHMHHLLGNLHAGSAHAKRMCATSQEIRMLGVCMQSAYAPPPRKSACWKCSCEAHMRICAMHHLLGNLHAGSAHAKRICTTS